ncbi:MAG: DUF5678 domain-containing protein [Chloroflexi bacterium]|nr:DUF5678 domain-containing protein [Chloroflexota bacterium]
MEAITPREPVVPQRPSETPEEITVGLQDYSARSKILIDNHKEFLAMYPDQWVAFGDNWKIVAAKTHEEVLKKLREAGGYSPHSVMRRLETNPPRRIPTVWRKRTG